MEQVRALPFDTLKAGLSTNDLAGSPDPAIGGGCGATYCFQGSGSRPTAGSDRSSPWSRTGGALVRTQSVFYSPSGCQSTRLHRRLRGDLVYTVIHNGVTLASLNLHVDYGALQAEATYTEAPVAHDRRPVAEQGMTLIEVITTVALFSVVLAIFLSVLVSVQTTVAREERRSRAKERVRLAVQQLDREVRSGSVFRDPAVEPDDPAHGRVAGGMGLRIYTQANADTRGAAAACSGASRTASSSRGTGPSRGGPTARSPAGGWWPTASSTPAGPPHSTSTARRTSAAAS